jgi:peptide deformylase
MPIALFVIHRDLTPGLWQVKEAAQQLAEVPLNDEGLHVLEERFLNVEDFDSFMNPKLLGETTEKVYDWEFCPSFPNIRCMVRRPTGIQISYIDEQGDEIEKNLKDFAARVFLHELDHINGRTMTHWRISEGNIEVVDGHEDQYSNFMTTVDFYKGKIEEVTS